VRFSSTNAGNWRVAKSVNESACTFMINDGGLPRFHK